VSTEQGRPLLVDVTDLRRRPAIRAPLVVDVALADLTTSGASVPAGRRVHVEIELESVPDGVVATGTVSAPWTAQCRRCLTAVAGDLAVALREVFEDQPDEAAGILAIVDMHVDLEPPVRDAVLLHLPLAPLCRDDCQGLCATCGADLNEGDCGCEPEVGDPRWAALNELDFDDESAGSDGGEVGGEG